MELHDLAEMRQKVGQAVVASISMILVRNIFLLQLQVQRETFVDDVRVTRCVLVEGSGSVYRVGAEFVQTRRAGEHSIRRAINAILRGLATKGSIVNSVPSTGEEVS